MRIAAVRKEEATMGLAFLGREFLDVELSRYDELHAILRRHPQQISGYTAATLCAWSEVYRYVHRFEDDDTLLISCETEGRHLLQPVGRFPVEIQQKLVEGSRRLPYALRIYGVTEPFLEQHKDFVAHFEVHEDRPGANYIYLANDLATLPGRKYNKKRNLLSQAARDYAWTTESLTAANAPDCFALLDEIARDENIVNPTGTLGHELDALTFTLRHLEKLGQQGLLVRVAGKPVAFALFEELTPDTAVIHHEKALRRYKGLYQVVNKEAASVVEAKGYQLINREEDLGDEGLRKAKMSYFPVEIRPAYLLTSKRHA